MRGRIGVRLKDSTTDLMVTGQVSGLRFRKVAPGGHHSASCTVLLERNLMPTLGPADRLFIYDTRTGYVLWEGYTENPTPVDGPAGQTWDISALGGMNLAQDMTSAVTFIDSDLSHWTAWDPTGTPGGSGEVVDNKLRIAFNDGTPVVFQSRSELAYLRFMPQGQRVGAVTYGYQAGLTHVNWRAQTVVGVTGPLSVPTGGDATFSTTLQFANMFTGGAGSIPANYQFVIVRVLWDGGAATVTGDKTYAEFSGLSVKAVLKFANGTDEVGIGSNFVTVNQAVNHVVGALLPGIDGATASIAANSTAIFHLTYDGATPASILDDLSLYNPDGIWEILETNPAGKHRFVYRNWPTTARYEVSVVDGYTATGGDVDLCNRILVHQTDVEGKDITTVVTSTVPELGTRVRDADPITIPISASAATIGAAVLASKAGGNPRPATIHLQRSILDSATGNFVEPWEVEPGYLVRVRETGETLRCTEMEYNDDDCSATLTLGNPSLSVEQRVAALTGR